MRSGCPVSLKNRQKEKTEMKTKTILAVILLTMMLIPVVSACPQVEPEPKVEGVIYRITIKNPQYTYIWDGQQWIYNTPTIIDIDGRTWVIYPKL